MRLEEYYTIFVILQLIHSQEEIRTGFYNVWPLMKMTKRFFVTFEIIFSIIIVAPIFLRFPYREQWMTVFVYLMLANGFEHLIWAVAKRKYVPGLVTALLFFPLFLMYYFHIGV